MLGLVRWTQRSLRWLDKLAARLARNLAGFCPAIADSFPFWANEGGEPLRDEEEGGIRSSTVSRWSSL